MKTSEKNIREEGLKIRIGSRESRLAKLQVKEVLALLAKKGVVLSVEHKTYKTGGDIDKKTPLTAGAADDFFTDALDHALLNSEIDVAVHSAKDLPKDMPAELVIFALTASLDETDAFVGNVPFAQLKPGDRVGTSSLLRQKSIKELNPNLETIEVRGTIEERLNLLEKGQCEGIVVATAALKRLGLAERIKDIFSWEATPLQGQLAVVGRKSDREIQKIFEAIDARIRYGKVALVGAGPGDPGLITVKGVRALQDADCVFYDYLSHPDLLLYAGKAEKIYVGKRKGEHALGQKELSRMLRQKALEGKNVVRLKGGDPLIFGRGADEIEYLSAYHIRVEVVPGVSSATGIPSSLGIPLTARGLSSSVAFVSGHGEAEVSQENRPIEIPHADTVIFLMGLTKLDVIVSSLKKAGWPDDKPMMVVSKGSRPDEKIIYGTIATIEELVKRQPLAPPALIIVSDTINFWKKPTIGREKLLYLGTNPEKYRPLGEIIHFPMIEIAPQEISEKEATALIDSLPAYGLILLTSRFAVHYFFGLLSKYHYPLARLAHSDFAVIGDDTRHVLEMYSIKPAIVAARETSEGLAEALERQYALKGKKVLFPRSSLPNPYLKEQLEKRGAAVREIVIYRNSKPPKRPLPHNAVQKIIFTSPSTVRNFLEDYGTIPASWEILSKGPHTQKALRERGYASEVLIYE